MSPTKGKYSIKSSEFKVDTVPTAVNTIEHFFDAAAKEPLTTFAHQLIADGWEPLSERGQEWWHLRFRRRVK